MTLVTVPEILERLADEGNSRYFAWTRQMLTLASSGLVLLVSLQNSYLTLSSQYLWLLQLCWAGLAASICLATIVLHGEGQSFFDAANQLSKTHQREGEEGVIRLVKRFYVSRWQYTLAGKVLPWALAVALLSLASFASLNLGSDQSRNTPRIQGSQITQ